MREPNEAKEKDLFYLRSPITKLGDDNLKEQARYSSLCASASPWQILIHDKFSEVNFFNFTVS